MAEAALQRLHAKFGDVRIVVALRGFNELWTDQPGEIDCRNHWCCHPHWSNRESTRRRPTPPLTRGGLVWELGSRPKTGNEAPRTGTVHWRPSSLFPLPSSLFPLTWSTARRSTALAPRSECPRGPDARACAR